MKLIEKELRAELASVIEDIKHRKSCHHCPVESLEEITLYTSIVTEILESGLAYIIATKELDSKDCENIKEAMSSMLGGG